MDLHELPSPEGASRKRKRVGRGESSGTGKTSGRGMNGQKARTGKGKPRRGFEGGQTPMYRRMPKRGFTNIFAKRYAEVNVGLLERFEPGTTVNLELLRSFGLASSRDEGLRVLGEGELAKGLTVVADHVTATAKGKIEAAGGTVQLVGPVSAAA